MTFFYNDFFLLVVIPEGRSRESVFAVVVFLRNGRSRIKTFRDDDTLRAADFPCPFDFIGQHSFCNVANKRNGINKKIRLL